MHSTWLKALFTLALPVVWLTGCGGSSSRITVPVAGGQSVSLERHGSGFKQAENDRVIISNPVLQAVNLDGNYYMRWNFTILPKQAQTLGLIHIEEVSDAAPFTLVNDVAPQAIVPAADARGWTQFARSGSAIRPMSQQH